MEGSFKKTMSDLNRISHEQYAEKHADGLVLVLDNIRSAHNVGSIFRTGDGLGVSAIYLCGITCRTDNRELQKTALGAERSIPSYSVSDTVEIIGVLKAGGYKILSLEQTHNSVTLGSNLFEPSVKYALVLGNEVEGVSEDVIAISDMCIEIPQMGAKHSLNVSNASAIVLWEFFKFRFL